MIQPSENSPGAIRTADRATAPGARHVHRLRPQAQVRAAPTEDKSSNTSDNWDAPPETSFLQNRLRFVGLSRSHCLQKRTEFLFIVRILPGRRAYFSKRAVTIRRLPGQSGAILMVRRREFLWLKNPASSRDLI